MKKILIINAVPLNNGDAALVFSLYESFKKYGFQPEIASFYFRQVKKIYSEYPVINDLTNFRLLNKIPYNKYLKIVLIPFLFVLNRSYRSADVIVSSPGGYLNSYYGFSRVAVTLITAKILGKKTAVYAQSVGPLNKRDTYLLRLLSKFTDVICARDNFSFDLLKKLKIKTTKIQQLVDAAFLLPFNKHDRDRPSGKVAVSVRSWKHDNRDPQKYFELIKGIVGELIAMNYKIEFVSTCQGIAGYIDDQKVAAEIVNELTPEQQKSVIVDEEYHKLNGLQEKLRQYDAVIGTRMHMCILSMINGVPAFNISYEVKGKEMYNSLGLSDFCIDYNEAPETARLKLLNFILTLPACSKNLESLITEQNRKAEDDFKNFMARLGI